MKKGTEAESLFRKVKSGVLPGHIAIIMDGNGRWAEQRGLPRAEGHRRGADALSTIIELIAQLEIPVVSLYAFSTENWKRPAAEVKVLFHLLEQYLKNKTPELIKQNIQLRISGDYQKLPDSTIRVMEKCVADTSPNRVGSNINSSESPRTIINLCLNYGGRDEILRAAQETWKARIGRADISAIHEPLTWDEFSTHLDTAGLPDVDLLIRTGGERRLSNFLLVQAAYAELHFTDTYWPDFGRHHFLSAIDDFQGRIRKFGGVAENHEKTKKTSK